MPEIVNSSVPLNPQELQALYQISTLVAREPDVEKALAQIVRLTRPVLIFDNVVVYIPTSEGIQPGFARIVGRGRRAEADLAWGESIAANVINSGRVETLTERLENWENNRLNLRFMLALPLRAGDEIHGALVFGRFGGPPFSVDQVRLSEFVATHVGQLLVRQQLVNRIAALEAERRLQTFQENFIAMVSHELRSPLGFIKGYTTTLLRSDINWDNSTRHEFLSIIDEEADRLRGLIDNLLDSSRLQSGKMRMQQEPIMIDELLAEIYQRARRLSEQLQISLDVRESFLTSADPVRFSQVIDNLISNAVKYAQNSPIQITVDVVRQHPLPYSLAGHVAIQDQGPGIGEEHLNRLFERFYRIPQANPQTHGVGLGLYICREIIHAHGGEIGCESVVGKGTTFHIYLPILDNSQAMRNPKETGL